MPKKDTSKNVKVRDLAPKKDAKGGAGVSLNRGAYAAGATRGANAAGHAANAGNQHLDRGNSAS